MQKEKLSPSKTILSLWEHFLTIKQKSKLPHALLLVGSYANELIDFTSKVTAALFCKSDIPCGDCKPCRLLNAKEHPDLHFIVPEKVGGTIKIEQIRNLQALAYTSPQLANKRIFVIHPAEKMNLSAANALLKLLEEPPDDVYFFLICHQLSTLPATIISRCQQWYLASFDDFNVDYLTWGTNQKEDENKKLLITSLDVIIKDLFELKANRLNPITVANGWGNYDFSSLIWCIYLINAQMIDFLLNGSNKKNKWADSINTLAKGYHPIHLFKQLDQLYEIIKKLLLNIHLNQTLALENLLIGYSL